ncbi:hypothetical protein [Conexibacter sp. CPCC 206217]|uniref:hypothetical protein n=1 Tax=Conexibacter sp. CPCC 206217 TaxID=3064574 RepID=UPI0027198AA3|nr:hypothetical protein [Conexibacter sp. CPCC 206217]MDO8212960.1 hypothetical protein [Conexibacter sp. CPCC 206217]
MRRRPISFALGGALLLAAALPAVAPAAWSDAQLASVDNARLEQADGGTTAVDLSGDGRWVVFQTRATNFFPDDDADAIGTLRLGGVFRFDRTTGAIQLVADGDVVGEEDGTLLQRGAARPSVSDDGRWVVFSTAQRLVPQDDNDNIDVYVRDMSVPLTSDRAGGGAYRLVSARDGSDDPAHYAPIDPPLTGRNPGADVFAAQAISADGRYVAFRTTDLASDLPARDAVDTSPFNVFVRDLATKRTVLVTRDADGNGAGGGLGPVVLSRDGSTVSWVGQNASRQTRFLNGENTDDAFSYYLWRRWDDAGATTRRVTGLADPDDPACVDGTVDTNPIATGPCYGPLADTDAGFNDIGSRAPALSADGWTVAFLAGAAARPAQDPDTYLDVFTTSMRPGVSRKAGTQAVTRGTSAPNPNVNGEIASIAMSADGSRLVLVSARRQYLPPAPPLVGDPRSSAGGNELYTIDLGAGGSTRRVLRPGGGDVDGSIDANAAVSADGRSIAFVSGAANLAPGDANGQPDAFTVTESADPPSGAPPAGLGADPINEEIVSSSDDLGVRAIVRRDGTLLLRVSVPGPGSLRAVAKTRASGTTAARARRARGGRRAAKKVKPAKPRQVAVRSAQARRRSTVQMTLRLRGRDRTKVRRGTPLPVRVTVTLTPRPKARAKSVSITSRFRFVASRASRKSAHR